MPEAVAVKAGEGQYLLGGSAHHLANTASALMAAVLHIAGPSTRGSAVRGLHQSRVLFKATARGECTYISTSNGVKGAATRFVEGGFLDLMRYATQGFMLGFGSRHKYGERMVIPNDGFFSFQAQKDLSYARMAPACKKLEEVSPPASPIAAFPGSVPKLKLQGDVPTSLLDADSGWGAPPSAEVCPHKLQHRFNSQ